MDAWTAGTLIGIALRTLAFPYAIGLLLRKLKLRPMTAILLQYPIYAVIFWPLMLFVTYGYETGFANIILDIPFLLLWMLIFVVRQLINRKKRLDKGNAA